MLEIVLEGRQQDARATGEREIMAGLAADGPPQSVAKPLGSTKVTLIPRPVTSAASD
jgi:hypothetical protein